MSAYDWPAVAEEDDDDRSGRDRFTAGRPAPAPAAFAQARAARALDRARAPGEAAPPNPGDDRWVALGPSSAPSRIPFYEARVTGRVRDLWVSDDGQRIYAGTALGGVWYSGDAGSSWTALGGFAPGDPDLDRPANRFATGSLLVVPGDPALPDPASGDEVLVGTGELERWSTTSPGSRLTGVGVLVSTGPATVDPGAVPNPWSVEATHLAEHSIFRLARDPGGSTVVAATSDGLWQRPPATQNRTSWVRVDGSPFDDLDDICTDVLWTPPTDEAPVRLWVWVMSGGRAGLWVRNGASEDFEKVRTPGSVDRRGVLAAATPPATVYALNDRGEKQRPRLFRIASVAGPVGRAEVVEGVPEKMLSNQGYYDLAIAVDPTDPTRVVLGGAVPWGHELTDAEKAKLPFHNSGAIFSDLVDTVGGELRYGAGAEPQFIGADVHADVHTLRFTPDGSQLWCGCDGGVFVSHHPTRTAGFVARNDDLAVAETNFLACHPVCEGHILTGLQDNGLFERWSSMVWRNAGDGDGGGVAFNPAAPTGYVRQTHNARWVGSPAFPALLHRGPGSKTTLEDDRKEESKASAFYSHVAAIGRVDIERDALGNEKPVPVGQILIGTNRPWYTEDWGATFGTLPSGTDPIGLRTYNASRDDFGGKIIACAWATPDVAWVLSRSRLQRYRRIATKGPAHPIGQWERQPILRRTKFKSVRAKNKLDDTKADGPIRQARAWTEIEPDPSVPPDFPNQILGAIYLGAVGADDDTEVDTLWWFDGVDTWHSTELRTRPGDPDDNSGPGIDAPVTAIVCDPDAPAGTPTVYVGTTVGVWKGERTAGPPDPSWDWTPMLNGLPEAKIEDLAIYSYDGLRLLRAAIASRGVWELRLDAPQQDLTYVRVHEDDLRYRARVNLEPRDSVHHLDPATPSTSTPRSWHASPDITIRSVPVYLPAPASLTAGPWRRSIAGPTRAEFQRFQAALRSKTGDERVVANGLWTHYFDEVLREFPGADGGGFGRISKAVWDAVVVEGESHATAEPWGTRPVTEADHVDLIVPFAASGKGSDKTSTLVPAGKVLVDVTVHHRGLAARPPGEVRVTLLRWRRDRTLVGGPHYTLPSTWAVDPVPWAESVADLMNAPTADVPPGGNEVGDGWRYVGEETATRRLTIDHVTLDDTTTGVVTFPMDLSGYYHDTTMLVAAIIRAGGDLALDAVPIEELTLTNPAVAVRSLRIKNPGVVKKLR